MRTLILMRHAEAAWGGGEGGDLERGLTARGEKAAQAAARWLLSKGLVPQAVLCSPARRTRQTAAAMRAVAQEMPEPEVFAELYLAAPEAILGAVGRLSAEHTLAMLIGHEPGVSAAARQIGRGGDPQSLQPAALCLVQVDRGDWVDFSLGRAGRVVCVSPRDLMS